MHTARFALFAALALPLAALAQTANPHNGTWKVRFDGDHFANLEGTLVVKDDSGSWKVTTRSRNDPCIGREAPIAVTTATADDLVFEVHRSKVLAGCPDWTMNFRKVDDATLKGSSGDGRAFVATRK